MPPFRPARVPEKGETQTYCFDFREVTFKWAQVPLELSSASYRRKRCRPAAAASGRRRAAGWGPPSSQSPVWFPPADRGWSQCPSSWSNSHKKERRRWPLGILCLCWLHLNCASGWMRCPWHLDGRTGETVTEWGNVPCEMNRGKSLQRSSQEVKSTWWKLISHVSSASVISSAHSGLFWERPSSTPKSFFTLRSF